jgi:alpha 1,3-glucosidase
LNDNAQNYWESLYAYDKFVGTTSIYSFWNDMNEPAVFSGDEGVMDLQMLHMNTDGTYVKHRDVHNAYGSLMQRTTHRGVLQRNQEKTRAFVLTRSFFVGSQKYGAYWTGDNTSQFSELQGSIDEIMSTSVSGMFFGGADIPGYLGNPDDDLFITFYQLGTFYPFFRAHCSIDNTDRDPWDQTPRVQEVIRETVFLRYTMIHYLYTAFNDATKTGVPIMRPFFVEFPEEESLFGVSSEFMWGSDILVQPKLKPSVSWSYSRNKFDGEPEWTITTKLPSSAKWYNLQTCLLETESEVTYTYGDLDIPLWARAGSILPLLNHSRQLSLLRAINDPLQLAVFPDQQQATG